LAQEGRDAVKKSGKSKSENLREIEAWLSTRLRTQADLSLGVSKQE
jgi:hypothetical protein